MISGIFLVSLSLTHNFLRTRALSIESATVNEYVTEVNEVDQSTMPKHIFIPWNTDSEITPQLFTNGEWTISPDKVSYLMNAARPGTQGNIILYGHNKRSILGNIRALKGGETITLTLNNGVKRTYVVEKIAEVAPTQTELLLPTDVEVLTLYTCSGPLDSRRFVVQAKPLPNQSLEPVDPGVSPVF